MRRGVPAAAILTLTILAAGMARAEEKPTAESIVARHLESLGWSDAKAAQALRLAEGRCRFEIRRGGTGNLEGKARVSSEGRRYGVDLRFSSSEYYGESLAYDGQKVQVGFIQPRVRSPMGQFLNTYDVLLKEGLVSGVLSTAWPLHDLADRRAKLKYGGLKKVGERSLHEIAYKAARGQSDVEVLLYFEPETFRHVRSEYRLSLRPSMSAAIDRSASQQDTRFEIEETFADFETAAGITLPKRWVLTFSMDGPSTNALWHWDTVIEKVTTAGAAPPVP
jgi:hypothetical protein